MRVVYYGLRNPAVTALRIASSSAGKSAGVVIVLQEVTSASEFLNLAPYATLVVVDLQQVPIQDVVPLVTELRALSPRTRISIINTLLTRAQEQTLLFDLGKISGGELFHGERCLQPAFWAYILDELMGVDALHDFFRVLQPMVPTDARGPLLLELARHAHLASVKQVVAHLYPADETAAGTKRYKLWVRCQQLGLASPENIHDALRLLLLKVLIDHDSWSTYKVANYLGYGTAKNLSRSCHGRYGLGVAGVKKMSRSTIEAAVSAVFAGGQSLTIRPNQAVLLSN